MLETIRKYYEAEYNRLIWTFDRIKDGTSYFKVDDVPELINGTIKMLLGVAFFAQDESFGLKFEDIDAIYEEYRKKINDLRGGF
jgi:hypothetical protein